METGPESARRAFADFLRARRERLDPRELGLPVTGRRRTPGLRREEVAQLAGVSVDYYTRLEQGRELRPSTAVMESLARALQLGAAERDHLFRLNGTEPATRRVRAAESVRPSVRRILQLLEPAPAFVTGRYTDVLAWNDPAAALITDFGALPEDRRTIAHLIFLGGCAEQIWGEPEAAARDGVGILRGVGAHPTDRRLRELVDRLLADSELFARLWRLHDVRTKNSGSKVFVHPGVGRFTLDYEGMPVDGTGQTLVVYTAPMGSPGEAALELLSGAAPRVLR